MKKFMSLMSLLFILLGSGVMCSASPGPNYSRTIQKEKLGRGLVAIHNGQGKVSVSWRYQESDPVDVAFDLYRKTGRKKEVKLNSEPLTKSTFFTDSGVDTAKVNVYRVALVGSKIPEAGAVFTMTPSMAAKRFLEIPVKPVPGYAEGYYAPNDAAVADLDGDGEYEIVVKLETRTYDNSQKGICPEGSLIDAYKLDGTFLWRVDLGINIRQGAHYTQMMLYDFDGDGKAELAVKTSEGTRFGDGKTIGDVNGDGRTDYRNQDKNSRTYGMVLEGPEFLSVIEGSTGKELARADFIPRGGTYDFGDDEGNRVDRFLGGAGYFDGQRPSILICRGYYAKTVLEAWDWRDGKLTRRWIFDSTADGGRYKAYEGQGAHNLRIGDVDGDGRDEVVYGACVIDDDGTGLYSTGLGHGDAMYLTDIDIDHPGLEVWMSHENAPLRANSELRDAATGQTIWGIPGIEDVGRAAAEDIDPRFRGVELWSSGSGGVYTADGRFISEKVPGINFGIWWDGDLSREILDGYYYSDKEFTPSGGPMPAALRDQMMALRGGGPQGPSQKREVPDALKSVLRVTKWTGDGVVPINLPDQINVASNNGTKSNPCISADIFGDWREEIVARTQDNKEIRIYMTDIPTDYRFYTLMSDNIYRMGVLGENICYNQPPLMGRYFGSDIGKFWNISFVKDPSKNISNNAKSALASDGRKNGMNERLKGTEEKADKDIVVYKSDSDKYMLDAKLDYDTIEWTLNGKPAGSGRTLTVRAADYGYDSPVQIGIEATYFGCLFKDHGTLTFSSAQGPQRK